MNRSESTPSRWARIIEAQRASGLSIVEFCRRRSISQPSFFSWRRRLSASGGAVAPAFVEVKVGAPEPGGATAEAMLELILRGGQRVRVRRGFDPELLRELVSTLESAESLASAEVSA